MMRSALKFALLALVSLGLVFFSTTRTISTPVTLAQSEIFALTLFSRTPQRVAQSILTTEPAQRFTTSGIWRQVYEQLPDFPLENQYISIETGDVAESNTLASRLIRYHTFIKGRPPNYRFDWKLTLADYLGVNELMLAEVYPGNEMLRTNPMPGDVAVLRQLNMAQRNALVDVLVRIFNTSEQGRSPTPTLTPPSDSNSNSDSENPASPSAADLLLP
jgi:hypothetical protein